MSETVTLYTHPETRVLYGSHDLGGVAVDCRCERGAWHRRPPRGPCTCGRGCGHRQPESTNAEAPDLPEWGYMEGGP